MYSLSLQDGKTRVTHNFTKIAHDLPDHLVIRMPSGEPAPHNALELLNNFSDSRAKIGVRGSIAQIDVIQLGAFQHEKQVRIGLMPARPRVASSRSSGSTSVSAHEVPAPGLSGASASSQAVLEQRPLPDAFDESSWVPPVGEEVGAS